MEKKIASKVPQRSLYLHNKNVSFDSSVVKSVFQNWPQKLFSRTCSDLPSFRQFISQFLNNRRVSIDGRVMLRIEGGGILFGVVYEGKQQNEMLGD